MSLSAARSFFDALNHSYVVVHQAKEDLFWSTYMAISSDDGAFARAEQAYKNFIADPDRLSETRYHLQALEGMPASNERDALVHGLRGWRAFFEAHVVEGAEGRRLMHELVEAEAALFAKRRTFSPRHVNERGEEEDATLSMLATNLASNPDESRRRTSYDGLRAIEEWVLDNGFLELVSLRNRLARALGARDFFELKLRRNERMTPTQLFSILDEFVRHTDGANARTLGEVGERSGPTAVQPWNLRFFTTGDVVRQMDEYLTFGPALRRWIQSFRRLAITFRGAVLQLDLLERPGKFQNGFCHSPVPAWRNERGEWVAGHINFTSEAKPDQVGSGARAILTLFHEGGHAAHFANVVQNAPCFSQEYAPTSMACAETQSMFCDSLLNDADWLRRYAVNGNGDPVPDDLIRARVATRQPMMAFDSRSIAVVPYFEAALYAMDDGARRPHAVLAMARETERRILGIHSPRPLLAIPHLLNQESAASYQGYLLAQMAVSQTRAFFLGRDGFITDNPAVGTDLSEHYWKPGNSVSHDDTLRSLTGEGFSPRYLAAECNWSIDEAWAMAAAALTNAAGRRPTDGVPALDATIRIVHGSEVIADSTDGEDAMCDRFESWVAERYAVA